MKTPKGPSKPAAVKAAHGPTPRPARATLNRLLRLHERLNEAARSATPLNCSTLAHDLEVSSKTIQRDLTYFRETLNLPLEYDPADRTFYYTRDDVVFPVGPNLTSDERIALMVARQCLEVFEGVDFGRHLRSALAKLTDEPIESASRALEGGLDAFLSVHTPGAGRADGKVFNAVRLAVLQRRELVIEYRPRFERNHAQLRLQPLHLACVANRWLLIARDTRDGEIRCFILARFRQPTVTQTPFARPADFDPRRHLGLEFGGWTSAGATRVRLRLAENAAHHVLERTWHPTQRVKTLSEGAIEVTFELEDLHDLASWVLGFGDSCEVVEPANLRAFVHNQGARMAEMNTLATHVPGTLGRRGIGAFIGFFSSSAPATRKALEGF